MIKPSEILNAANNITKADQLTRKAHYLSHGLNEVTHKYAIEINNAIDFNNAINELKQTNRLSDLTRDQVLKLANTITKHNELLDNIQEFEAEYSTLLHEYANVLNEKYELENKLKEVGL